MKGISNLGNIAASRKRKVFKVLTAIQKKGFITASNAINNVPPIRHMIQKDKGSQVMDFENFLDKKNSNHEPKQPVSKKIGTKTRKKRMRPTKSTQWGRGEYDASNIKKQRKSNQPVTKKKEPRKTLGEKGQSRTSLFL